jgi:hypothetical protein
MVPPSPSYPTTPDDELEELLPLLDVLPDVTRPPDDAPAPLDVEVALPWPEEELTEVPPLEVLEERVLSGGTLHAVVPPSTVATIANQSAPRAIEVMSNRCREGSFAIHVRRE